MSRLEVRSTSEGFCLRLRVSPKASSDRVAGPHGGALKISVRAAPERGQANEAVVKLLAALLGVSTRDIEVVSGLTSQNKVLLVRGYQGTAADLERALLSE
ncbi:MAG: DUF167 domain-containing protein [Planctomycetaceae bacterium]|nr:hypothetical protein [Planctomycetota bacterium]NUO15391.1 DUF167 domain-containing protein [Planctomycetaceae bacterium]HRJ79901.1 DUF167 domain-containing protein [Planctomycetota bacterium]